MTELSRTTSDAPAGAPCKARGGGCRRLRVAVLVQVATTVGFVAIRLASFQANAVGFLALAMGLLAILAAISVLVCCGSEQRDIVRLRGLLGEIKAGREPVASLSGFDGFLSGVASACHDLAHDLRTEKAKTAQLENETRQRIAHRTEALERTIGALRQQASRDGLTGVYNRRSLDAYLPDAIERCKASGSPLCVLMIDIDYFKPLNDTLGHAAGDQMLKSVAQLIRSTVRENDLAFRCGGDEFVVVLEQCGEAAGRGVAARLGRLGDSLGKTFRLNPPPSLSIGLSMLSEVKEQTAGALLARADTSLYQVKSAHHTAAGVAPRKQSA